jgi:hypothetical protein
MHQYDWPANADLDPRELTPNSTQPVAWVCENGHRWTRSPSQRAGDRGCWECERSTRKGRYKAPEPGESLAEQRPEVAAQWDDIKNAELTPYDVTTGSSRKVWWRCEVPLPEADDHHWDALVKNRTKADPSGCPMCSGLKASSTNNLTLMPGIAVEWDYERNGALRPENVTLGYGKGVHWQCSILPSHRWHVSVKSRVSQRSGCPDCSVAGKSFRQLHLAHEISAFIDFDLDQCRVEGLGNWMFDMVLPEQRVIVEYDGEYWHRAEKKQEVDRRKTFLAHRARWTVIRARENPLPDVPKSITINVANGHSPIFPVAVDVLKKIEQVTGTTLGGLDDYIKGGKSTQDAEARERHLTLLMAQEKRRQEKRRKKRSRSDC